MTKREVGNCAGNIWILLSNKKKLSLNEITRFIHARYELIFLAIGWLLRENKILINESNGNVYYELVSIPSEMYY